MNPSTADILEAIELSAAPEVIVLPNNGNVIMSAEQAVALAGRPAAIVPTRSIQAGLSALLAYDPAASAEENAEAMREGDRLSGHGGGDDRVPRRRARRARDPRR